MQKKTQLLKWAVRLLALLVVGMVSFSGKLPITQAVSTDSCHLVFGSNGNTPLDSSQVPDDHGLQKTLKQQYTLTCDSPHTSCTLVLGSGDTTLDKTNLSGSPYLSTNLQGYNLNCQGSQIPPTIGGNPFFTSNTASTGSCHLVFGSSGNTPLDSSQVPDDHGLQKTLKQQYSLTCDSPHTSCTLVLGSGDTTLDKTNLSGSSYLSTNLQGYNLNCQGSQDNTVNTGSCHLVFGSSGNTPLDSSKVPDDTGLQKTLKQQYTLTCDTPHTSCTLVLGSGDTTLDKTNLSGSSYLSTGLQGYNLNCQGNNIAGLQGGSCQLVRGTSGTTRLDTDQVKDKKLVAALKKGNGYSLNNCSKQHSSCELISGINNGDTLLDLSNISTTSSLYKKLSNKYSLTCNADGDGN